MWFRRTLTFVHLFRNDTKEDVFVHQVSRSLCLPDFCHSVYKSSHPNILYFQTAIKKNNPRKYLRSVGDGETVEFDVVEGEKVVFFFGGFILFFLTKSHK